ncbi:hypothetical protein [Staphylothermus hellenicus]|uniref:Uncharacterized protein n=1 Tax=Staphylothermus hellenicus (strain DSM 12710 / JCM 10830 / BK20S6-10-b1 / P8) TaxID=591019 RepID=D7D8P0_STAHD|nr:hypothetical protein [Staphylothermus hellenicus]ADI32136.1 hypothetical protein Shell_1032 [Staphylothermus hellenicus DSM 12710]
MIRSIRRKEKSSLDSIVEDMKYTARILAGGPDERGEKLLKASGFFLVVPDPTMISTSIGLSMIVTGKLLMKRRKKGIKDYIEKSIIEMRHLKELAEELI